VRWLRSARRRASSSLVAGRLLAANEGAKTASMDGLRAADGSPRLAVVIPCYRVTRHVAEVIRAIGPEADVIYCVDDACPDQSGDFIERAVNDRRVRVLRHRENQGVGGAVMTGYLQAVADGARVIVKLDGDGQMDPQLLPLFVAPVLAGQADYTKGNRFYDVRHLGQMPPVRILGNAALSFLTKLSTGYWDLFDPTNGYTAISADVVALLPLDQVSRRYFFETDLLFRLSTVRAMVVDVPMDARYRDETSSLRVSRVVLEFAYKHTRNLLKRLWYNYFLRNLSAASLELVAGGLLLSFGITFGGWHWWASAQAGVATPVGTIMIATVAVVSGLQFLVAFLSFDVNNVPRRALHPLLHPARVRLLKQALTANLPSSVSKPGDSAAH